MGKGITTSWSDWTVPKWRNSTPTGWLAGKRGDDGAEGLWRVHNGLYDLTTWVDKHPGGAMWLTLTKGTDVTEVFESHHITLAAEKMLPQFLVREAKSPRNSPYTFHPNGFYRTLKSRVREHLEKTNAKLGPSLSSIVLMDFLAVALLVTCAATAAYRSFALGVMAGLLLTVATNCSHNFFHQRNNWRMYIFNFSLMSYWEWRISHALSHHIYTNTVLDLEMSNFEPFFQWLPSKKSYIVRYLSWIYAPIVYTLIFPASFITRLGLGYGSAGDLIPLVLPTVMLAWSELGTALLMWAWIIGCGSFFFGCIGLTAAHHHPEIFHEGDTPREDRDWGLNQVDAVRDRIEVTGVFPLVMTTYGDHTLHHLFPTLDHALLNALYPLLADTCKEFGVNFKLIRWLDMVAGNFRQLAKQETNMIAPGHRSKME